jgi:hypothetical protein
MLHAVARGIRTDWGGGIEANLDYDLRLQIRKAMENENARQRNHAFARHQMAFHKAVITRDNDGRDGGFIIFHSCRSMCGSPQGSARSGPKRKTGAPLIAEALPQGHSSLSNIQDAKQ